MSLSKECQEYHLTPGGWTSGSFTGDILGESNEQPNPADRVLTFACYDELPSAYSKPNYHVELVWKSDDKQLIEKLMAKWGERPNWFGYSKMKED